MHLWGKQFSIRHGIVRRFHVSDAALVKIGKILLVVFFAVTELSDFILKKKLKYVSELVASDHLETGIGYKEPEVSYQRELSMGACIRAWRELLSRAFVAELFSRALLTCRMQLASW